MTTKHTPGPCTDEYQLAVVFKRSRGDDSEPADAKYPDNPKRFVYQLRDELQAVYDEGHLAGSFNILLEQDGDGLEPIIADAPAMLEALRDALPTIEDAVGIYDEAGREAARATVGRIRAILERHQ